MLNFTKDYILCWVAILACIGVSRKYTSQIDKQINSFDSPYIFLSKSFVEKINKLPGADVKVTHDGININNSKINDCDAYILSSFKNIIHLSIGFLSGIIIAILIIFGICLAVKARKGFYIFWLVLLGTGTFILNLLYLTNRIDTNFSDDDKECIDSTPVKPNTLTPSEIVSNILKNINNYATISCAVNIPILILLAVAVLATKSDVLKPNQTI